LVIEAGIEFSKMKKIGQEAGEIELRGGDRKQSSKKELGDFGVKKKVYILLFSVERALQRTYGADRV